MKRYAKIFSVVFAFITIATSAVAQSLYSYRASGVWDNPYSWTIVSGGLQYQNDENLYPAKDGVMTYRATISENRTMTFNGSEDIQLASLDVKGTLILEGERSILVDNLTGKGEIQLKSFEQLKVKDSEGVYKPISSFAGTISLNGTVSLNAVGNTYNFANIVVQTGVTTITGKLSVSNNVTIKGAGTLMFADVAGNELTIGGDLIVNTGGLINATGTNENVLIVKGNVTNNGIIGVGNVVVDESDIEVSVTDEQVVEKYGLSEPSRPEPKNVSLSLPRRSNEWGTTEYDLALVNVGAILEFTYKSDRNYNSKSITLKIGNEPIYNESTNAYNLSLTKEVVLTDEFARLLRNNKSVTQVLSGVTVNSIRITNFISTAETEEYEREKSQFDADLAKYKIEMEGEERQRLLEEAINNAAASSCYVTACFTGSKDAVFRNNGTAKFYRIRGQKDKNRRIEIINTREAENLKVVAQAVSTDSKKITDYRDLPWSVSSGILSLGDGVRIDTWGVQNKGTQSVSNGSMSDYLDFAKNGVSMYIPAGAALEIAGAQVNAGVYEGKSSSLYIAGSLVMKAGRLEIPEYSFGIVFVPAQAGEPVSGKPSLNMEGGEIKTCRIIGYNNQSATLNISDGIINLDQPNGNVDTNNLHNRSLVLSNQSQFSMTGGIINVISQFSDSGSTFGGFVLCDERDDSSLRPISFNVTGGTINITRGSQTNFHIIGLDIKLHNLNISGGVNVVFDAHSTYTMSRQESSVRLNDLSISGANSTLDVHNRTLYLIGIVEITDNGKVVAPTNYSTIFSGSTNTTYKCTGTNFSWNHVVLEKAGTATLTIDSGSALRVGGNLTANFGNMVGKVSMCGTQVQYITDESEEGLKQVELHLDNNSSKEVTLASNVYLKTVVFNLNKRFYLEGYNLKLDQFPTRSSGSGSWSSASMFYTNNDDGAGGVTVPIDSNGTIYVGTKDGSKYYYSYVKSKYILAGKYYTFVPVHGKHPILGDAVLDLEFKYYFKLTSEDSQDRTDTYTCYVKNDDICNLSWGKKTNIAAIMGETVDNDNAGSFSTTGGFLGAYVDSYTLNCKKHTNADYTICGIQSSTATAYITFKSGEWSDKIWRKSDDNSANPTLYAGTDFEVTTKATIKSGHTVIVTKKVDGKCLTAGNFEIEKGATLEINGVDGSNNSLIDQVNIATLGGEGTLQYNIKGSVNSGYIKGKLDQFYKNPSAKVVYQLSKDYNLSKSGSGYSWDYRNLPNVEIVGEGESSYTLNIIPNNVLNILGKLTIGKGVTVKLYNKSDDAEISRWNFEGDVEVSEGGVLNLNKDTYIFKGAINNAGTIAQEGSANITFKGNIVNDGIIDLEGCDVMADGDQHVSISGTATTKGDTNLGILHLNKSMGSRGITTTLPLGNAEGLAELYIDCGIFKHQYSGGLITYKGDECFSIPAGSKFSLEAGSARFYVAEPTDDDCPRVKLSGEIEVAANTTLDNLGGIGYTSGSVLMNRGTINAAFLAPFSGDADIRFHQLVKDSYLNLGRSAEYTTYEDYGVFDIREGSDIKLVGTSYIYIYDTCKDDVNSTFFFNPSVTSISDGARFYIYTPANKNCRINSFSPIGLLYINGDSETRVLIENTPLSISRLHIVKGRFFCCGIDLTIRNISSQSIYLSSNGAFYVGDVNNANADVNTVSLVTNKNDIQGINSALPLTFNNLYVEGESLEPNCNINVNGELRVNRGTIKSSKTIHSFGDVHINVGASISQGTLIMESDSHEQGLYCEGEIANLYINNQYDVLANSQQAKPITITNELQFQKGRLIIGGNMLDIKNINEKCGITKAKSVQFGPDMMIATNNSFTDRGVRLNFNAGETANMTIPMGSGSKYAPFILNGVTAESSGNITVVANNSVHTSIKNSDPSKTRFLKYYWMVTASSGFRISSGSFDMQDDVNDAVGFDECKTGAESSHPYVTCFLNSNTGDLTPATGIVSLIDDNLNLEFSDIKGKDVNGIYTAGCRDDIPTEGVPTYISISSGAWSGEPIWKRYNRSDGTYIGDAMQVENKSGCRFIVDHDVTLHPSNDPSAPELGDSFLNIFALEVRENGVVDFNGTENNNLGIVTGTGKIIFRSGDIPGANYDGFFGADGGTVEYSSKGVASDYNVFVGYPYHNNVIFSGKGKRFLPTSNVVTIHGDVTVKDEAELVLGGKDVVLEKNLTFVSADATTSGDGAFIFSGSVSQNLSVAEPMYLAGIGVNNTLGVMVNDDITVDNLTLTEGRIIMAGDKILRMHDASSTINVKNSNSYVDGWFSCYAESGKYTVFPVGNGTRSASTDVYATSSGFWKVRYHNRPYTTDGAVIDKIKSDVGISIDGIGNEYWEVDGPANARIRLRWDELSNVQDVSTLRVITQRNATPDWKYITYSRGKYDESTGVLVTASQTSTVGAGPRIFLLSTSAETASFEWLGGISSSWSEKGNWSKDAIPTLTSDIIIRPVGDGAFALVVDDNIEGKRANANSIIIEPGAVMTLRGAGTTLNVKTNLTIQTGGQMKVVYDADANPNFYVQGTISGDVNVERVIRAGRKYYTGSATTERLIIPGDGWDEAYVYIRKYDHPNYKFVNPGMSGGKYYFDRHAAYEGETNSLAESLNTFGILSGTGSKGTVVAGDKYSFFQEGTVSNATKTYTLNAYQGSNWYSNPYPFSLKMSKDVIRVIRPLSGDKVEKTIYTYESMDDDGSFAARSYNFSTGASTSGFEALAPFQGFEILCQDRNKVFNSNNVQSQLELSPVLYTWTDDEKNVMLKSSTIDPLQGNILRLFAGNDLGADEVVLLLNDEGSMEMVPGDSEKKANSAPAKFNQISTHKGDVSLVITHMPSVNELIGMGVTLPINLYKATNANDLSVWIKNIDEFNFTGNIYLVDNLAGVKFNLTLDGEYNCPEVDNLYAGRFELAFEPSEEEIVTPPTAIEVTNSDIERIRIWVESEEKARVTILGNVEDNARAVVFDIMGREIISQSLTNRVSQIAMPSKGVYVVNVINGKSSKSEKLVL